jgi:aminoglycoside phosphotransferase (APT) family kinase protein
LSQSLSDRIYEKRVVQPVPEQTLRWVEAAVGRGARVVSVQRMHGGSSTAIHAVDARDRRGVPHRLVLRRFIRPNWKYPGLARREAVVLELLERARYPAPRLVAFDDGPRETDVRALLMTRLPGRVELAPERIESWLRQMAEALLSIHAIPLPPLRQYRPYYDPRTRNVPAWSKQPKEWDAVIDLARSRQPRTTLRFIHRDYHPGNILWSRGKLSGVVDWISACAGPPQVDVAHCRVNLVRLHGVEIAERFLVAYASASGTSVEDYDPYWDAIGLADSGHSPQITAPALAPLGLTLAKVRARLDEFAASIAGRS